MSCRRVTALKLSLVCSVLNTSGRSGRLEQLRPPFRYRDLADHDDVRVLTENGSQSAGKRHRSV